MTCNDNCPCDVSDTLDYRVDRLETTVRDLLVELLSGEAEDDDEPRLAVTAPDDVSQLELAVLTVLMYHPDDRSLQAIVNTRYVPCDQHSYDSAMSCLRYFGLVAANSNGLTLTEAGKSILDRHVIAPTS